MKPNIGEGTPPKVSFSDVYKDAAEVKTDAELPVKNDGFRALLPYLLGGVLLGSLAKFYS